MIDDLTHNLGPGNYYADLVGRASEAAWEKDPILAGLAVELNDLIQIISYNDDRFVRVMKKAGEVEVRIRELERQQVIKQRLEKPCGKLLGTWVCLFDKTEQGGYIITLKNGRFLERYEKVTLQKQQTLKTLSESIENTCVNIAVSQYGQNKMILYSDKNTNIRIRIDIHNHANAEGTLLNTFGVEIKYYFDAQESAKTFWQGIEALNPVAFFPEPKWFSKCFTIPEGEYSVHSQKLSPRDWVAGFSF